MNDDEKLILLVRDRSEIYNKCNPLFKFIEKKQEAWMEIANEMDSSEDLCMKRWTTLRDRFTRECKRMEQSSESEAIVTWPYFELMEFIRPFVAPRPFRSSRLSKMKTSKKKKSSQLPSLIKKNFSRSQPVTKSSPTSSRSSSRLASPEASSTVAEDFAKIFDDPLIETPLPNRKTIIANPIVDKSFCEAVEALKKACARNEARHANPAVHAFGEMIVSTISSMNSRNQLKVMQQVTDTVMKIKLEEDELLEQVCYSML